VPGESLAVLTLLGFTEADMILTMKENHASEDGVFAYYLRHNLNTKNSKQRKAE